MTRKHLTGVGMDSRVAVDAGVSVQDEAVRSAVQWAIQAVREAPGSAPNAPVGWAEAAAGALEANDLEEVRRQGILLRYLHMNMRADFGCSAWLYDLRRALPLHINEYEHQGLIRRADIVVPQRRSL